MHAHSSLFSLATRLHQCCSNHSPYINTDLTISGQTLYIAGLEWSLPLRAPSRKPSG